MSDIILIVLLVLLVIAPVIAAIIALIHAVIDSVTKKRFPNIIAMLLLLIGIGFLIVWLYGDNLSNSTNGEIFLCFGGLYWSNLRIILQGLTSVFTISGLAWYIFLSFREDSVVRFQKRRSDRGSRHKRDGAGSDEDADAFETEEEIRESNRRTARLYRILTVSVAVVLAGAILAFVVSEWVFLSLLTKHEVTEYTSPDGQYTVVVDNVQIGSMYYGRVYLRLDAFKVRKLEEKEDRRKYLDIQYEDITWQDQGISIPYGNMELFYYYEPVGSTD